MLQSWHIRFAIKYLKQIERIHETRRRAEQLKVVRFLENVTYFSKSVHRAAFCRGKGWPYAASTVDEELPRLVRSLSEKLNDLSRALSKDAPPCVNPRDIIADLQALETEFDGVVYNLRAGTISAVTEDITLEGVYLGPFEIRLDIRELPNLRERYPFSVRALDPHPAVSDSSVTHPHVSNEKLCAGDAAGGISSALESGRILDFYHLVNAVLATYNRDSPYVRLDRWDGTECHECGYMIEDEDDRHYCDNCEHSFCESCFSYCRCCEASRCLSCLTTCPHCEDYTCGVCMESCQECGEEVCKTCMQEGLCPDCIKKKEEEDGDDHGDKDESGGDSIAADDDGTAGALAGSEAPPDPAPETVSTA